MRPRFLLAALACVVLAVGATAAALYGYALPELSSARPEPPKVEIAIAAWLLRHSVPEADRAQRNPLESDRADIVAGRDLFREKCEICHGYDGSGRTQIGAGEYPRPPPLRALAASLTDGEMYYHIRNGIRNTGMPAWNMPERQIWQLVLYIRHLPITVPMSRQAASAAMSLHGAFSLAPPAVAAPGDAEPNRHYVGSAECRSCHAGIYDRWKTTPMANVVRDPRQHPEAITPDLSKPDPLVTFGKDDIAFVYGSLWKQRYFKKVGDDYFPEPAQWDITHHMWRKYFVRNGADWWAPLYPPDNFQRPTGPLCDGCHSVNYDINTRNPTEWNVGCERCHGPGSEHVKNPVRETIINPARLDYVHANDTCIQCHSQGRPLANPINGKYYDWPVGFHMGLNLDDFWKLEEHKLGETTFTHFPDGTAHKNRMQGNDFVQSLMYNRGVACFSCHDVHGTRYQAQLREPPAEMCFACHGTHTQNGPHTATIEEHTHHKPGSPGSQCIACHMPRIEQTIADVSVRAHTFRFITPAETDTYGIPNPCTTCHKDKPTSWAASALKTWQERSPWRMGVNQ
ncbi:cytochrome C [Rhodopila globiformis]|uniref:Cytochrome C n=2 Tax=Rhodopila globiformis TaxID=1071 RepID=A0A2S6NH82_RHOGL|nr:cytochrome C [Rhodopila globiformis]